MNKKLSLLFVALLLSVLVLTAIGCSQHQPIIPTDQIVTLTVNYDRSLETGVSEGHYDYANSDISKNFSVTEIGVKEIQLRLIHFDRVMSTGQVLVEMDRRGLRPANIQECLAFGEKYPDIQREFPTVFLGSVWQDSCGRRHCPCLSGGGSERYLALGWVDGGWSDVCRFAAVSK